MRDSQGGSAIRASFGSLPRLGLRRLGLTPTKGVGAPPFGFVFLLDEDGAYLTDDDGYYLLEAA